MPCLVLSAKEPAVWPIRLSFLQPYLAIRLAFFLIFQPFHYLMIWISALFSTYLAKYSSLSTFAFYWLMPNSRIPFWPRPNTIYLAAQFQIATTLSYFQFGLLTRLSPLYNSTFTIVSSSISLIRFSRRAFRYLSTSAVLSSLQEEVLAIVLMETFFVVRTL